MKIFIAVLTTVVLLILPASAQADFLDASPASVDFGTLGSYLSTPTTDVTFTNNNPDPYLVGSVNINGSGYYISYNPCTGNQIDPGNSCTVSIYFNSSSNLGVENGTLEISDGIEITSVPLTVEVLPGSIQANPSPLQFSPQPWYNGGQWQNISISVNDYGVQFGSASISGPDASAFSISGDGCSSNFYYSNQTCYVGIQYNPTVQQAKQYNATLTLNSNASNNPVEIPLQATALNGPGVSFNPSSVNFGDLAVGESKTETITVTNSGDYTMIIQQMLIISANASYFPISNDSCQFVPVAPGETCAFDVTYQPQSPGEREASVFVITNTPNPVQQVSLRGSAFNPAEASAFVVGSRYLGSTLACQAKNTNGEISAVRWLRNNKIISGPQSIFYVTKKSDLGFNISCRVSVENPVSSQTVTSNSIGPITEKQSPELTHPICRLITGYGKQIKLAGSLIKISSGFPVTGSSPLVLNSNRSFKVQVGSNIFLDSSKKVSLQPRELKRFSNGQLKIIVSRGKASKQILLTLSDCQASVQAFGQRNTLKLRTFSSQNINKIKFDLSKLKINLRKLKGQLTVASSAGTETFPFYNKKTRFNQISLRVKNQKVIVDDLPESSRRVYLKLRSIKPIKSNQAGNVSIQIRNSQKTIPILSTISWVKR